MLSTRALAAVSTLIAAAIVLISAPAFESRAADPPPANLKITGPDTIPLGTPAVFKATVDGTVTEFVWGAGPGGSTIPGKLDPRVVTAAFARAGAQVLKLRVTGPGGTIEATKAVNVLRPDVSRVSISPRNPAVGQPVQIRLIRKAEPSRPVRYFSWRIAGVKPQTRILKLGSVRVPAGARTSATTVPAAEIRLAGAQPTSKPALTQTFSKAGTFPVRVGAMGADGRETVTITTVRVTASPISDKAFTQQLGSEAVNVIRGCGSLPTGIECPQITYDDDVLPNVVKTFAADPAQRFCIKGPNIPEWRADAGFTPSYLPYPAPEKFAEPGALQPQAGAQAGASRAGGPSARAAQDQKNLGCAVIPGDTVQWRYGDENPKPEFDPNGKAEPLGVHTYTKAGLYKLDVLSRVYVPAKGFLPQSFLLTGAGATKTSNGDVFISVAERDKLVKEGKLLPYLVVSQETLNIRDPYCDLVRLKGIPSRAYVGEGNPFFSPDSCFLIERSDNGGGTAPKDPEQRVYSLMKGASLSLNGIAVRTTNEDIRVDAAQDAIYRANPSTSPAFDLTLYNQAAGPNFSAHLGTTPRIDIPDQTQDADLKIKGSLLPDYKGKLSSGSMYGFPVKSARVILRQDVPATAKVVLDIPKDLPLSQISPLVVVGSAVDAKPTAGARAAQAREPDFEMDLSGVAIGPIQTKDFVIKHFRGEGWEGGGFLLFDFPSFKGELQAKYLADGGPRPKNCAALGKDAGPSGLKISDDGKLVHVGASLKSVIPLGPVDITCLGAFFTQKPYAIQGLITANAPTKTETLTMDGCVQVSVLQPKESVLGCAGVNGVADVYTAGKVKETWITVRAELSALGGKIDLANGGVDVHTGSDVVNVSAFGSINQVYFGPWRISGSVDGLVVVKPESKSGFMFRGSIQLALGACPACADVKAIVSSKGVGACVDVLLLAGGFLYKFKNPGKGLKLYGGCDYGKFAPLAVSTSTGSQTALTGLGPAGFAAQDRATQRTFVVRRGTTGVALDVESVDGRAPILSVAGPGRLATASPAKGDDGSATFYKQVGSVGFLVTPAEARTRDPESLTAKGRTVVKLVKPAPGTYTLTTQPGSPGMASVGRADKLPERKITADIVKVKGKRMLDYTVLPVPGQTVEFIETGARPQARGSQAGRPAAAPFVSRIGEVPLPAKKNGVLQAREGLLPLTDDHGTAGQRTVMAIISQDGVPMKEVEMTKARYVAPGPPKVPAPKNVQVKRLNLGTVETCWDRVPDARFYEVAVASSVGRRDLRRVQQPRAGRPCLRSTGFYADTATSAKVKAVTEYGETPVPSGRVLTGRTTPLRRLILQP